MLVHSHCSKSSIYKYLRLTLEWLVIIPAHSVIECILYQHVWGREHSDPLLAGDLVTYFHRSWHLTIRCGKHFCMPSGTIDPCCKVHEVDAPMFPCSFEVGNGMVSYVVLDLPRVSGGFVVYFPHFCRQTHTKATYLHVTWLYQMDDSTVTHATNGIEEISQSARTEITRVNISSTVISALDVKLVP